MTLKEIATIRTGLILKRKTAKEETMKENGAIYKYLTLKSITQYGEVDLNELGEFIADRQLESKYLIQKNDIIMRLTYPYTVFFASEETLGIVITSNFASIRMESDSFLSSYLCWYLNSPPILKKLQKSSRSEVLSSVGVQAIATLPLVEIPFHLQKQLGTLYQLQRREQVLLEIIATKKQLYLTTLLESVHRKNCKKENENDK